jgi:inosine/xanthosine triphosphate pyrophosphatase family protein
MEYPDPSDLTLVSSNPVKIKEFKKFAPSTLKIVPGDDVREVAGTADEVIIHKALAGGQGRLVEDTIIIVDGHPWVDVKWRLKGLREGEVASGTPITWQVRLGTVWGDRVYSYLGEIHGVVCPFTVDGSGMDPVFLIQEAGLSLAELDARDKKTLYSARRLALENLVRKTARQVIELSDILPWKGAYQNE